MQRATRDFIRDRQCHTDFVVGTMSMAPHPDAHDHPDPVARVSTIVRRYPDSRAVAGWRVAAWDPHNECCEIEPDWFIVTEVAGHLQAWDLRPGGSGDCVMDQGLAVARRDQLRRGTAGVLPPTLVRQHRQWWARTESGLQPLKDLSAASIFAYPRYTPIVFDILATSDSQ